MIKKNPNSEWRGGVPAFAIRDGNMVILDWETADEKPGYSGVAFDCQNQSFVLSEWDGCERSINYLQAESYEDAVRESIELKRKLVQIGDTISWAPADEDREVVSGVVSHIKKTEGGRLVYVVATEELDGVGDLKRVSVYQGNGKIEVCKKGGCLVMNPDGTVSGVIEPGMYLGMQLNAMRQKAAAEQQAQIEKARLPAFEIVRPDDAVDMPDHVIQLMNRLEREGKVALIMYGLSSHYSLYQDGHRKKFDGDWGLREQGPFSSDTLRIAMRYRSADDIVAMTSAAKQALQDRRQELEEERLADIAAEAQREMEAARRRELAALIETECKAAKFVSCSFDVKARNGAVIATLPAFTIGPLVVHATVERYPKGYVVSLEKSGCKLLGGFTTKAQAKLAAARLSRLSGIADIGPETSHNPEFETIRNVVRAMLGRDDRADPLAEPEIDGGLYENKAPEQVSQKTAKKKLRV